MAYFSRTPPQPRLSCCGSPAFVPQAYPWFRCPVNVGEFVFKGLTRRRGQVDLLTVVGIPSPLSSERADFKKFMDPLVGATRGAVPSLHRCGDLASTLLPLMLLLVNAIFLVGVQLR